MIKEAINRILELAAPSFKEINNEIYCDRRITRVDRELRAEPVRMNTLSSLVEYVKHTHDFKDAPYMIQVVSPTEVRLVSGLDSDRQREVLAEVHAEIPEFPFGQFVEKEKFIIGVQSKFVGGEAGEDDKAVILAFAGNVKAGTVEKYGDDGVSQKAAVKRGVTSLSEVEVPSPCVLMPYRTFTEVPQPAGSFIFRVKDSERGVACALFEADGGAWKNAAKAAIREYLEEQLAGGIMIIS